jgi:4-aminobutyrate aminotransferase-like enzyme
LIQVKLIVSPKNPSNIFVKILTLFSFVIHDSNTTMNHIIWTNGHPLLIEDIVDSDNCYLYDSKGNQYTDLESGTWSTSVGHNNKRVNKVITEQINTICHTGFCYIHPQLEKTAEHILVMSNEVTTGIGRTGKWFGYQHYPIVPDIVAMGKGIGNGYPVSITAISEKVASKLAPRSFKYGQSHQNDPLGACVANEVIRIIEEQGLLEKAEELGNYLKSRLVEIKEEFPLIQAIRGRGLMLVIELKNSAQTVFEKLLEQGFIVAKRPNTEILRIDPALTVEKESIDRFLDTLREILQLLVPTV